MRYNLKSIMHNAWRFFRKGVETFAQALKMAWANAKAHNAAKAALAVLCAALAIAQGNRDTITPETIKAILEGQEKGGQTA